MMTHASHSRASKRSRGLSLIELMIALLIGLMLIAGAIQIFLGTSQTYRLHEGMSRVQENVRFGMETMQRDVRMAGFTGCARNLFNWLDPDGSEYSDALMGGMPVAGWEFSNTGPGDSYTLGTTGSWTNGAGEALSATIADAARPGSDVLVLNRAERLDVTLSGNPSPPANTINTDGASGIPQGTIIAAVTATCSGGDIWQKTNQGTAVSLPKGVGGNPGNITPDGGFSQVYDNNASIYEWVSVAYFIGTGANGEPALFRQRVGGAGAPTGGWPQEELVEAVENMQVLYGVDTNNNKSANQYITAADVTDWDQVVSVRLSLLMASGDRVNSQAESRTHTLLGTQIDRDQADRRIRQVATTTIGLRNRLD
ncbi:MULTISPECIES: PilW family protein [unclassified Thioalkalivibrio]|uniref:PilW family protein n=1 Tax=unclassified Thioalkalivibrio TaxID=2621013 RepID=UPI000382A47F|nr:MULTISPECIES: PilW family protein [unclassified Thioalkalivibrio]